MELLLSEWRFGVYRSIVMSYQLPLEPVQGISVERRRAVNRLQKTLCPPKCYDDTTQSPRFLSHDRTFTVVALSYQGQSVVLLGKNLVVPSPTLTTNKHLLSCNILFLLLSNHLLGPRIAIEGRKQVND